MVIPAHRRNPLDRQVLGTYRPPPASVAHQWREDVGHCVCCWSICDRCRLCRCQSGGKGCTREDD